MSEERPVDRVYRTLKEQISSRQLSPNESLIEQQIAQECGVSRATVKKAILMLEQDGLVLVEANKSARVRAFSKAEVHDFLEFRQELEGYIARMATPYFSDQDIADLERIIEEMRVFKEAGQLMEYSKNNQVFHNKIMEKCPNHLAVEITQTLKTRMRKYNTRTILVPGRADHSFAEHNAILDAIRRHSPEDAEKAMRYHIAQVQKEFEENFELFM